MMQAAMLHQELAQSQFRSSSMGHAMSPGSALLSPAFAQCQTPSALSHSRAAREMMAAIEMEAYRMAQSVPFLNPLALSHSMQHQLSHSLPSTLPQPMSQGMPQSMSPLFAQSLPRAFAQALPQSVSQALPQVFAQSRSQPAIPRTTQMSPQQARNAVIPLWLQYLRCQQFFTPCTNHYRYGGGGRTDKVYFCIDCPAKGALCAVCTASHAGHTVLQIRRSSYHEAIRVHDIARLIDLRGIQTYVINSAKIVFLNGRPSPRRDKGSVFSCVTCKRSLMEDCRYCSIGCKVQDMNRVDPLVPEAGFLSDEELKRTLQVAPKFLKSASRNGSPRCHSSMGKSGASGIEEDSAIPPSPGTQAQTPLSSSDSPRSIFELEGSRISSDSDVAATACQQDQSAKPQFLKRAYSSNSECTSIGSGVVLDLNLDASHYVDEREEPKGL